MGINFADDLEELKQMTDDFFKKADEFIEGYKRFYKELNDGTITKDVEGFNEIQANSVDDDTLRE